MGISSPTPGTYNSDGSMNVASNISTVAGSAFALGQTSSAGSLPVTIANDQTLSISGTVTASGALTISSGTIQVVPAATGGLSISSTIIPNNTTAIVVKGSAGTLYGVRCYNNSAVIAYLKIYNATSATAGSGTPVSRHMIPAPAAGGGGGLLWSSDIGVAYGTGITFIVTTGIADNDTGAPAASTYIIEFLYK